MTKEKLEALARRQPTDGAMINVKGVVLLTVEERDWLVSAADVLREMYEDAVETDAYPTSDEHPVYKARKLLTDEANDG